MSLLTDAHGALTARLAPGRLLRFIRDMIRYAAASVFALALDYAVLMSLTKGFGVGYLQAAAAGFLSGLCLIYLLSIRYVFEGRRARAPRVEILGFLVTGVIGLLLTEALMRLFVGEFGFALSIAKAATAGFVFMFNFVSRRGLLFKTER
ncbi:GtrA family protein [Methylocystis sp. Sn-Cys]|uniref:GtrA family protein n=1 Tax=Methylocystis sp. Sn-Cys TaxID=1701263 RepID=UPI001923A69D|nr:GtrA family protein [Methylocystis sp. Sn-Cys]MBL1255553.1 GtrA family protein [Methylocystis sp. Sn-Cys]